MRINYCVLRKWKDPIVRWERIFFKKNWWFVYKRLLFLEVNIGQDWKMRAFSHTQTHTDTLSQTERKWTLRSICCENWVIKLFFGTFRQFFVRVYILRLKKYHLYTYRNSVISGFCMRVLGIRSVKFLIYALRKEYEVNNKKKQDRGLMYVRSFSRYILCVFFYGIHF